jgi:hypothetical protein
MKRSSPEQGWREIHSFAQPKRSVPPSAQTPSNALAAEAVRIASNPPGIDGRQMPLKPTKTWASRWPIKSPGRTT